MYPVLTDRLAGHAGRIRTLVADDEPLARELMSNLVRRDPELELVGTACSGSETLCAIERFAPQLLLLDIQMPNLDGISVAEQLSGRDPTPYVVFVTAHDSFALQAFAVAARDYLVKPVSKRRFASAMRRARTAIVGRAICESPRDPVSFVVHSGESLVSLVPNDIVWVAAANQYVRLHTVGCGEYMLSKSLRQFARELPGTSFTRIHRSSLINRHHLVAVSKREGRFRVHMCDGSSHGIARSRKALVSGLLKQARDNALR